jgi:hypothetical protein
LQGYFAQITDVVRSEQHHEVAAAMVWGAIEHQPDAPLESRACKKIEKLSGQKLNGLRNAKIKYPLWLKTEKLRKTRPKRSDRLNTSRGGIPVRTNGFAMPPFKPSSHEGTKVKQRACQRRPDALRIGRRLGTQRLFPLNRCRSPVVTRQPRRSWVAPASAEGRLFVKPGGEACW